MTPIDVPLRLLHALIPWTETVPSHNNPHSILPLCAFCTVQLDDEFKSTHFVTAAHTGDTTKAPNNPKISKLYEWFNPGVIRLIKNTIDATKKYDYKFVGLSHNTLRGAAGGAVLCAETLKAKGYITKK